MNVRTLTPGFIRVLDVDDTTALCERIMPTASQNTTSATCGVIEGSSLHSAWHVSTRLNQLVVADAIAEPAGASTGGTGDGSGDDGACADASEAPLADAAYDSSTSTWTRRFAAGTKVQFNAKTNKGAISWAD